jgi:hypothetical protein
MSWPVRSRGVLRRFMPMKRLHLFPHSPLLSPRSAWQIVSCKRAERPLREDLRDLSVQSGRRSRWAAPDGHFRAFYLAADSTVPVDRLGTSLTLHFTRSSNANPDEPRARNAARSPASPYIPFTARVCRTPGFVKGVRRRTTELPSSPRAQELTVPPGTPPANEVAGNRPFR